MIQYTIYMHKFPNEKKYIGITCQKPYKRWSDGKGYPNNKYMTNAILKYGWDNIEHIILYTNLTKEEAEQKEIELIDLFKTNNRKYGYNIQNGGFSNGKHSKETRIKISLGNKGKKHTEQAKIKMSIAAKGKKHGPMSEKTKEKQRLSHLGKHHTLEVKKQRAKSVRCIETGIIYYATIEAERQTNIPHANISYCCKGKRKTAGKLHWEFID